MMIHAFASLEEFARLVTQAVLNGLWQGLLVTLAVALGISVLRRSSAATRHLIWSATLLVVVMLPVAAGWSSRTAPTRAAAPAEIAATADGGSAGGGSGGVLGEQHVGRVSADDGGRAAGSVSATPADRAAWQLTVPAGPWLIPLVGLGLLVAVARLAGLLWALVRVRQLKFASRPPASPYRERLEPLRARHVAGRVEIRVSDRITTPLSVGFFRPVVLLPAALLEELAEGELAQITLHELAHVRRLDHWTNLAQRTLEAVFFFNPAVRWIGKRLELERELACDEYAVASFSGERSYARCLTRLAEIAVRSREAKLAPGAASSGGQLTRRVRALLSAERPASTRICLRTSAVLVCCLIAGSTALLHFAPEIGIRPLEPQALSAAPLQEHGVLAAGPTGGLLHETGDRGDRLAGIGKAPAPEEDGHTAGRDPAGDLPAARALPRRESRDARPGNPRVASAERGGPAVPADERPAVELETKLALDGGAPDCDPSARIPECAGGTAAETDGQALAMAGTDEEPEQVEPREKPAERPAAGNRGRRGVRINIGVGLPLGPRTGSAPVIRRPGPAYPPHRPPGQISPAGSMIEMIDRQAAGAAAGRGMRSGAGGVFSWRPHSGSAPRW